MKKRTIILIDGSNFYFKLRDLGLHNMLKLNLPDMFLPFLEKSKLVKTTYYIGKIRTDGSKKSQELFNKQRQLIAHLQKHDIRYSLGYLLKSDGNYHEKGVEYIGFSHAPSLAMIANCTTSRLLTKQDIQPHYKNA